jgi:hypothetical protein
VEPVDDGADVDVGAVVVVVGHAVVVVVVVVVPLVVVVGSHGTVVVVVLEVVVVVVVDGGAVVVVVGGRVVVVVLPGPAGGGVVVDVGGAVVVVDVGLLAGDRVGGRTAVRFPPLPGTAVAPAAAPEPGASVETWSPADDPPSPEPRMLAHATRYEVTERSQFTSRRSLPPLNHLRARTKSPQRSVSSRTLGRKPTAMLTAAMSNRSAA